MITGWEKLQGLRPLARWAAEEFLTWLDKNGVSGVVTSGTRSFGEQYALWLKRLAGRHPYPVASPWTSAHVAGIAFDFVPQSPYRPEDLRHVAPYFWLRPGVDFRTADPVHYDLDCAGLLQAGYQVDDCIPPKVEV